MNIFFTCFFIAISLSMDAFSLAILYGTYGVDIKAQYALSIIVGLFHFFMPLIGLNFGGFLVHFLDFNVDFVVGVIFGIIGFEMVISTWSNKDFYLFTNYFGYLVFGFTVSLDSLTTGIGLSLITDYYIGASIMFMVVSGLFTFVGLRFGNYFSKNFGKYACFLGGIIMICFSVYYIF